MGVMVCRVAVLAREADGWPSVPSSVGDDVLHDDSEPREWPMSTFAAREWRDDSAGVIVVVVPLARFEIAANDPGVLALVFARGDDRSDLAQMNKLGSALRRCGVLRASWAVDSSMAVPALDSDPTVVGQLARASWPSGWRRYLAGEGPAVFDRAGLMTSPQVGPTGAICVAASLAA